MGSSQGVGLLFARMHLFAALLVSGAAFSTAQAEVCSVVRIQIQQELTLERQAFDAHMRITNGLDLTSLENIDINVWFKDADGNPVLASSDPDNTTALFFITLDQVQGLSGGINGNGTIGAGVQADIHWLIIPAPGAGGEGSLGELYQVGASLSYSFGGESESVEVAPDFIQVRPMPMLTLDYFLPEEVIGEDPLAPGEQEPTPFPLAVRIKNSGNGPASNLAIESAQPEIVENNQGLLINFELLNTQVNDGPVLNSLLAEFGDLAAGESVTAIWQMVVSLYGHFISFDADYYHSDSLGGTLTSLIESVNTHTLVGVVINDLPGRDSRRDFLALDGDTLMLYESEGADTPVSDHSAQSSLNLIDHGEGFQTYQWSFPATAGPVYAVLVDPTDGQGEVSSVWRSDGKNLSADNYWQMPTKPNQQWINQLHLFDANSTGSYQVIFAVDSVGEPAELVIDAPELLTTGEDGSQSSFSLALSSQPTAEVSVPLVSNDSDEGIVAPSALVFDQSNWNQPQTVTVTGINDDWLDGDVDYQVLIGPASSEDANFDGLSHPPLPAVNLDSDIAGLILAPASGLATAGSQTSANFEISLTARPVEPVTISLESSQPQWAALLESSIVLDSDNWDIGVSVVVAGQDDPITNAGNHSYTVTADISAGTSAWLAVEPESANIIHRAGETWAISAGRVELPALTGDSGFVDVSFDHPFDSVPIVVLIGDDGETAPASVRLGQISETGFSLVQVQPAPSFALSDAMDVHYLAMEPGTRILPGGARVEAGMTSVSAVQAGEPEDGWHQLTFSEPFGDSPVLLTSIQSLANEQAEIPHAGSSPWLTVATSDVGQVQASVALERSGLDDGDVVNPEQLGWIAFDGQFGQFESGSGQVEWQSNRQVQAASDASCARLEPWVIPASESVVLAGLGERDAIGGWLRLCADGQGDTGVMLQLPNEMLRGETPALIEADTLMFNMPFHTRLPYLPDVLFRDRFHQQGE